MKKERIDRLLVEARFTDSLEKARALIMSGTILVNEKRVEKPSEKFSAADSIRIKGQSAASKFVGRGGLKLEEALRFFHIRPSEYICLDIGASTGGFTDCLLQNGAKKVVAVDAGTNQIDWKLRTDGRVEVRENTNARNLSPDDFTEKFDLIVMDVSFISATKILPVLPDLLKDGGKIIVLIKPQFELPRGEVGAGGIVRQTEKHQQAIEKVNDFAALINLNISGTIESPITGAEGNREFLSCYAKSQTKTGG